MALLTSQSVKGNQDTFRVVESASDSTRAQANVKRVVSVGPALPPLGLAWTASLSGFPAVREGNA